jgi:hypothetical protein
MYQVGPNVLDAVADIDDDGKLYDPEPLPVERFAAMSNDEFVTMCDNIMEASVPSERPLVAFQQLDRELTLRSYTGYDRPAWERFGVDHSGEIGRGMIIADVNIWTYEGKSYFGCNRAITTIAPHFGWFMEMFVADFNYRNVLNIFVSSGRQKRVFLYYQDACSTSNNWRRLSIIGEYSGGMRYEVRLHRKLARLSDHVRILVYIEYGVGMDVFNLTHGILIKYETVNRDLLHGDVLPGARTQYPLRVRGAVARHRRDISVLSGAYEEREHDSTGDESDGDAPESDSYALAGFDQDFN